MQQSHFPQQVLAKLISGKHMHLYETRLNGVTDELDKASCQASPLIIYFYITVKSTFDI